MSSIKPHKEKKERNLIQCFHENFYTNRKLNSQLTTLKRNQDVDYTTIAVRYGRPVTQLQ